PPHQHPQSAPDAPEKSRRGAHAEHPVPYGLFQFEGGWGSGGDRPSAGGYGGVIGGFVSRQTVFELTGYYRHPERTSEGSKLRMVWPIFGDREISRILAEVIH